MVTIRTTTQIDAPLERCFRLSLSVDLERDITGHKAVDGVTRGLLGPGESVTWSEGLGLRRHKTLIDVWRPFSYFRDVMLSGPFLAYEHEHHFAAKDDGTRVRDEVRFIAPGVFGRIDEYFFLRRRMIMLLRERNAILKRIAESDAWHRYLDGQPELDRHVYQARSATPIHQGHVFAR